VITHTGKVLDTTATYKYDRVLLKVMTLAGYVGVNLLTVGQSYTGYFTHCRVRLLGSGSINSHTYTATLGTAVECRRFTLILKSYTSFSY